MKKAQQKIEEDNEKCTCEEYHQEHTCPYALEINDDESLCNCCPYCEELCADDI